MGTKCYQQFNNWIILVSNKKCNVFNVIDVRVKDVINRDAKGCCKNTGSSSINISKLYSIIKLNSKFAEAKYWY